MSERINIANLEQLDNATHRCWYVTGDVGHCGDRATHKISPQFTDRGGMSESSARVAVAARNALPALLRLAWAADSCAKIRPQPHVADCPCRWCVLDRALAAFDFGSKEPAR